MNLFILFSQSIPLPIAAAPTLTARLGGVFLLMLPILIPILAAPVGVPILGYIALNRIRNSGGQLYGMGMALFDLLFFPLLALDALIGWSWYVAVTGQLYPTTLKDNPSAGIALVLALLTSAVVDFFIVRAAWRAACGTADGQAASAVPSAGTNGNLGIYSLRASLLGVITTVGFMVAALMSRGSTVDDVLLPAIVLLFGFELPAAILGIAGWKTRLGKAATMLSCVLMLIGAIGALGVASRLMAGRLRADFGGLPSFVRVAPQLSPTVQQEAIRRHGIEAQLSRAVVAELHKQDIAATVLDCHLDRNGTRAEARITGARYEKDARGLTRRTPIGGQLLMEAGPARPNRWQVRGEDSLRDLQFAVVLGLDAARPVMEQFLAAVRAGDLEKMKTLSLGSVNGWLDREQAQRLLATRLSGIYLPAMTEMLENLRGKIFAGRLDSIRLGDGASRDQWAATSLPTGVGDDQLVVIFCDTSEGWRFVHWEIMEWTEKTRPPLMSIVDDFAQRTQQTLDNAKAVVSRAAASKPADATQEPNEGAGGEAAVREVALRFLTAVRDNDLPTMKSLSLGAYEGWMSDQQAAAWAQQHERILPGLHATTLEKSLREMRDEGFVKNKNLAGLTDIRETVVLGDFAAVGVPGLMPAKNPKCAIVVFKKTPQGWRFLWAEDYRGPLGDELKRNLLKFEQLLRGVKREPAAAAAFKSAEPVPTPDEAADSQKAAHLIHELAGQGMTLPPITRVIVERYQAGQLHGAELKAAIVVLEKVVAPIREANERDRKAAERAKNGPARPGSPPARLEFRIMPNPSGSSHMPLVPLVGGTAESFAKGALQELAEKGPEAARLVAPEFAWIELAASIDPPGALIGKHKDQRYILLCAGEPYAMLPKSEDAGAWRIEKAEAVKDEKGQFTIAIQFDTLGGQRLGELTKANLGNTMAIVADGRVVAAPRIQSTITRQVQITGRFTEQEARDLAKAIQSGAASGAPPVPPPGKESTEKGPEARRADPLKSTRADQMRTIVLAGLEFAMDHPEWPEKLDELKPRYVDADKIDLGRFVYHSPGRQSPAKNPQEVAVLSEKEPAFAGGQLVGFADGYVAFIRDPELLRRLLPVEAESPQPSNGQEEAK